MLLSERNLIKEVYINTIIHEILHVLTNLKGGDGGHGKDWEYLASYVSQNTKYNITRYVYENRSPIKEKNSLFGLTELEQREKISKMMELDQEELFTKFILFIFL